MSERTAGRLADRSVKSLGSDAAMEGEMHVSLDTCDCGSAKSSECCVVMKVHLSLELRGQKPGHLTSPTS